MEAGRTVPCVICIILLVAAASLAAPLREPGAPPSKADLGLGLSEGPNVLSSSGGTTWLQVHTDSTYCPGDPAGGHGGEATGGPGPLETWCFERGPGDSCGTNPPWDTNCFSHVDFRTEPSQTGINFWHVDTYRADQRAYCGEYALWCGSDGWWEGKQVECGTWYSPPGYGNWWNCVVELTLPSSFSVAGGCTLLFDPRYDCECNYDYFYVDFWSGIAWVKLATFNATSNDPGTSCDGPDYWDNSELNRLTNCDWQERFDPDLPAFYRIITPDTLGVTEGPMFRWRFFSDAAMSDADHYIDTDGGAFIDNVWVWGDSMRYEEDFEGGVLDTAYWSLPDHEGILDAWHISLDPDPPDEPVYCVVDSSYVYRARPEGGYQSGQPWRNEWAYRLMTPPIPMLQAGCKVQFDLHCLSSDGSWDNRDVKVRFHDSDYGMWCPWERPWENFISSPCWGINAYMWTNNTEELTWFATPNADSVQFAWEIYDPSQPNEPWYGKHGGTEMLVDNVSIGFYDVNATEFSVNERELLHDTFFAGDSSICGYNSWFESHNADTVETYRVGGGNQPLPRDKQLVLSVNDRDGLVSVELMASVDEGSSWISKALTYFGEEYFGTVCPSDFGLGGWETGTQVWYYVQAVDELAHEEYFPAEADPSHPGHTGGVDDYFEFCILPLFPETYLGPRLLLVDGYEREVYDWAQCLTGTVSGVGLDDIYEQVLTDAGYCYDRFDIGGMGSWLSYPYLDPVRFSDYDAVVWFTGLSDAGNYGLISPEAQQALSDFLGEGGKVVLCGDRLAHDMGHEANDALGGEFFGGIMGSAYLEEMPDGHAYPYLHAVGVESLTVRGLPVALALDTVLVFRECPYLKYMSYIRTETSPPPGYTAQPLLEVGNPTVAAADAAVYTEYLGAGQCVFVDFDLSACVNHTSEYCPGVTHPAAPDFDAGYYDGRVELMRTVLEDIFGLPSGGSGGPAGIPERETDFRWALAQNLPNPCAPSTEIRFEIARAGKVRLTVYNALGQVVRVLADDVREPGRYGARWDGRNAAGEPASSGVYFYRLETAGFSATRKMLVLR